MKKVVTIALLVFTLLAAGGVRAGNEGKFHFFRKPTHTPTPTATPTIAWPTWTPTPTVTNTPTPTLTPTITPTPTETPLVQGNRTTGRDLGLGLVILVIALYMGDHAKKGVLAKTSKRFQKWLKTLRP